MKKFLVFILAVLYFGLSTGATVHLHYCMGKLVESSVWYNTSKEKGKCSKCGMLKGKNKCCKDEYKHLQIGKDQQLNDFLSSKIQLPDAQIICPHYYEFDGVMVHAVISSNPYANAPPEDLRVPVYLRNCVFRI
jgi:hypothetical protein